MNTEFATYVRVFGIGIIAGVRSMSAPACVSAHLARSESQNLAGHPLSVLASPTVAQLLKVLAAGEMIADKLPIVPARVSAGLLIGRVVSGAVSGAAMSAAAGRQAAAGVIVGGVAAMAGAWSLYYLRQMLAQETGIPDPVLGAVEDALVIGGGMALCSEVQ